jgi:hypothetical protein
VGLEYLCDFLFDEEVRLPSAEIEAIREIGNAMGLARASFTRIGELRGDRQLLKLARSLVSESAEAREAACGTVTDWIKSFSLFEARLLSMLLTLAAMREEVADCLESELHALSELLESGFVQPDILDALDSIDQGKLGPAKTEYIADIFEWLNETPEKDK